MSAPAGCTCPEPSKGRQLSGLLSLIDDNALDASPEGHQPWETPKDPPPVRPAVDEVMRRFSMAMEREMWGPSCPVHFPPPPPLPWYVRAWNRVRWAVQDARSWLAEKIDPYPREDT